MFLPKSAVASPLGEREAQQLLTVLQALEAGQSPGHAVDEIIAIVMLH